jgi:glycosyltransferase involved in cell wall biosynthesis
MEPLITIIIPLYNTEKYIYDCVLSVIEQEYKNIEIIVINDGSTDNSVNKIKHFLVEDKRLKIIEIENAGVSNARNVGVNNANGTYIVFIDADDYITKDYISYMYNLASLSSSELIISLEYYKDINDTQVNKEIIEIWDRKKCTEYLLYPKITVGCWNKMYKLDFLKKNNIKFQKELFFGEGLRFITDVSQRVNNICVGNRKVYYYRLNNSSCTAVHDVRKAKASLNALNSIENNLLLKDKNVKKALLCHYWINNFLAIRFMKRNKLNYEQNVYRENCIKYIRKNIHHVLLSDTKIKIKVSSIIIIIFPNTFAKLYNMFKGQ